MTPSVTYRHLDNAAIISLQGAVDCASGTRLRTALLAAAAHRPRPATIVVDLGEVDSVDRAAIGTFIVGMRICQRSGIDLQVRSPKPLVRCLLAMSGRGDAYPPHLDGSP
jgi:anti-anti-sigma factor